MKDRRWLTLSALTLLLFTGLILSAEDAPEKIYHNGTIITMNDEQPTAEAIAVSDGRIVFVGSKSDALEMREGGTELIDLDGRTMLPGFVDAHGHVFMGGLQALSANLLAPPDGEVKNIRSLQETLKEWSKNNQQVIDRMNVIIGFGYDNATLAEQRHPTKADLDQISTEVPVLIIHQSGHIISVNSKALEDSAIDASTPDPAGGVIRRIEGGDEPDGVLEEIAAFTVLFKLLGDLGDEGGKEFIRAGTALWGRFGYTTAQEARATPGTVQMIQQVADAGELKIDLLVYPDVLVDRDFIRDNYSPTYENRMRVAGAKLTIDGSPQGFTAWRDRPYYDPVGNYPPGYVGYAAATNEQVIDAIDWAFENDIQIITHANGEAASDLLIAGIDAALKKHGDDDLRPTLIHGQFLREDQVDSYNRLGVIPSLFPMHTFYWGDWHREHTVGPELSNDISPTGWCVERGMKFTSHHDAPVAFPDSMRVLDATVTRRSRSGDIIGPDQRVDVMTALKAMTIWPAWQVHEDDHKGSIQVGKLADFVVLDKDPRSVDPETLDTIQVLQTIKEGEIVFDSETSMMTGMLLESSYKRELAFGQLFQGSAFSAGTTHSCGCHAIGSFADALVQSWREK